MDLKAAKYCFRPEKFLNPVLQQQETRVETITETVETVEAMEAMEAVDAVKTQGEAPVTVEIVAVVDSPVAVCLSSGG